MFDWITPFILLTTDKLSQAIVAVIIADVVGYLIWF